MIDTGRLATFALTAFVIIVTPGPSVLFVLSRAVAWGRKAAVATAAGNEVGLCCQVAGIAAGVGGIVQRSATVFMALKLVGGVYLLFLGARAVMYHRRNRGTSESDGGGSQPSPTAGSLSKMFREGFVVGITNPKTAAFFAAVLPEFVDRARGQVPVQLLVLGAVFVAIALICDSAWGLAAGSARTWFASSPARLRRLGAAGGLVMIGLGIDLLLARRVSSARRALAPGWRGSP